MELQPISHSGGVKSISDDDLCAQCHDCNYRPGEMSGYVQTCAKFRRLDLTNRLPQCFASFSEELKDARNQVRMP